MSKSQGGNKKRASPSDIAYQQRRKAGGREEINRKKKAARVARVFAKKVQQLQRRISERKPVPKGTAAYNLAIKSFPQYA